MSDSKTKFISLAEAAKMTKYKQDYLGLLCRQGKLKGEKFGRNWVTTKEWVLDYAKKIESKGEEIIPVKIIKFREDNEETKTKKFNIGYPKIGKLLPIGGFLLAALITSAVVGGFIFADGKSEIGKLGNWKLNQKIIALSDSLDVVSDYGKDAVEKKSDHGKNATALLSDSLNLIKDKSAEFAARKIFGVGDSLNVIKNESYKFPEQKIIALNNSLNLIENKSAEFVDSKIIAFSSSLNNRPAD